MSTDPNAAMSGREAAIRTAPKPPARAAPKRFHKMKDVALPSLISCALRGVMMNMSALSSCLIWAATMSGRSLARPRTKSGVPTTSPYSVKLRSPVEPSTASDGRGS